MPIPATCPHSMYASSLHSTFDIREDYSLARAHKHLYLSSYRIMRRCWHIGAQSRPDFEDLLSMITVG
jgi:hypothetical protein